MKALTMVVVAAVTGLGCVHSQTVDKGAARSDEAPRKAQKTPRAQRAAKPTPQGAAPAARPPAEQGRPELSVTATGLMLPEGPGLIQAALVKRGYLPADHHTGELDSVTTAALKKFQADQAVARTGSPDRETVRKLGLSVDKVFRTSASAAGRTAPPKRSP